MVNHLRAACLGVLVETGLRVASVRRVSQWLGLDTTARSSGAPVLQSFEPVVAATDRVLGVWPRRGRCLRRSLVLGAMLRAHRPVLRIGVRRRSGGIVAHAWLEIDGVPVGETSAGEFQALS
ncbi:MAG: lasso peptide biosynthesis B2 protein [Myxococcales bacterium]|nr:lasso peptide biosynthesis B2 protein [Myxococcales bacterium]